MKKIIAIVVIVAVAVYLFGFAIPNYQEKKEQDRLAAIVAATPDPLPGPGGPGGGPGGPGMGGAPGGPGGPGMGGPGMGGPRRNPMEDLKDENGNIVLAKLDESDMPDEFKERMKAELTEADADADGLLNEDEQKALEEIQRANRLNRTFDQLKNDEGQYDLSKLEDARMFPAMKDAISGADADGDGFLSEEELAAAKEAVAEATANGPGMRGPGGPGGGPGMRGPAPEEK